MRARFRRVAGRTGVKNASRFARRFDRQLPAYESGKRDLYVRNLVDPDKIGDAAKRDWICETILAEPWIVDNLRARDGGVSAVNIAVKLPDGDNAAKFSRVDSTGAALMFAHIGEWNIRAMLVGTGVAFLVIAVLRSRPSSRFESA